MNLKVFSFVTVHTDVQEQALPLKTNAKKALSTSAFSNSTCH